MRSAIMQKIKKIKKIEMSQCLNPDCLKQNGRTDKFCQKCGSKLLLRERYRGIKLIGQGGFGRTFLARDEDKPSKPYCVIKQFLPQAQGTDTVQKASELFKQEAVRLDDLGRKHDQIPELFACFTQDNRQYLVQEYIDGQNLAQELKENGVFDEQSIRTLLIDLLNVLQFIHSNKLIHRDIKPENIIRRKIDSKLVLVDFGAAKYATTTALAVTGTIIGSAEYIAPEQGRGKAINASDLYSLGVTCINLMTNITPFDLYSDAENDWLWRDYLVNNPVSDQLGQILDKLIQFGTRKRYQEATEVLKDLNPIPITPHPISTSPIQSVKSTPQRPTSPPSLSQMVSSTSSVELKSSVGVDYTKLRDLLAAGKWQEANLETDKVMKKAADYIDSSDIEKFPCADLRTIDQLWVKYSNGRFGFTVQKEIYQSLGGTREYNWEIWEKFGDPERIRFAARVGWGNRWMRGWLYYNDITFSPSAPAGHLPVCREIYRVRFGFYQSRRYNWIGLSSTERTTRLSNLFFRVETCLL